MNNDAFGLAETIEDLQEEGKKIWWKRLDSEAREIAKELMLEISTEGDEK